MGTSNSIQQAPQRRHSIKAPHDTQQAQGHVLAITASMVLHSRQQHAFVGDMGVGDSGPPLARGWGEGATLRRKWVMRDTNSSTSTRLLPSRSRKSSVAWGASKIIYHLSCEVRTQLTCSCALLAVDTFVPRLEGCGHSKSKFIWKATIMEKLSHVGIPLQVHARTCPTQDAKRGYFLFSRTTHKQSLCQEARLEDGNARRDD